MRTKVEIAQEYARQRWALDDDSFVEELVETARTAEEAIDWVDENGLDNGLMDPLDAWMEDPEQQERRRVAIRALRAEAKLVDGVPTN